MPDGPRGHTAVILFTLLALLLPGCANIACLSYSEASELERFTRIPGYAEQHRRDPIDYSEIRDRETVYEGPIGAAQLAQRGVAIGSLPRLLAQPQMLGVTVPANGRGRLELRVGPIGQPHPHVYELESQPCGLQWVGLRRYLTTDLRSQPVTSKRPHKLRICSSSS